MKKLIAWGVKLAPLDPPLIEGKGAEEAGVARPVAKAPKDDRRAAGRRQWPQAPEMVARSNVNFRRVPENALRSSPSAPTQMTLAV